MPKLSVVLLLVSLSFFGCALPEGQRVRGKAPSDFLSYEECMRNQKGMILVNLRCERFRKPKIDSARNVTKGTAESKEGGDSGRLVEKSGVLEGDLGARGTRAKSEKPSLSSTGAGLKPEASKKRVGSSGKGSASKEKSDYEKCLARQKTMILFDLHCEDGFSK